MQLRVHLGGVGGGPQIKSIIYVKSVACAAAVLSCGNGAKHSFSGCNGTADCEPFVSLHDFEILVRDLYHGQFKPLR